MTVVFTHSGRLASGVRTTLEVVARAAVVALVASCASPEGLTSTLHRSPDVGDDARGAEGSAGGGGAPEAGIGGGLLPWDAGEAGGAATEAGDRGDAGGAGAPTLPECNPGQFLPPGDHQFKIASKNGTIYRYVLVVPPNLQPGARAPLVVVWHALWSSPEETRALTHVDATLAAHGAIGVYPASPSTSWDAGSCCLQYGPALPRDESVFARELVAEVESKLCIDTRRVYTAGFSNGGMLSQVLACKMADVFAASAPMASTLTIPAASCNPSRPIPIFMINGTLDPLVGYSLPTFALGTTVPQAFSTWVQKDGCTGQPKVTLQKGAATCSTYDTCNGGADVTLCTVQGMGHCMPGMKEESPINCLTKIALVLGPPNHDIDGIDMVADFLFAHTLP